MRRRTRVAWWMLAAAIASTGAAAEVYKWVDDKGRVHYGDRPPAGAAPAALSGISVYDSSARPKDEPAPARSDGRAELATCLTRNGAQFYGASWCPQCKKQLAYFGASAGSLPYIECSTDGSKARTSQCTAAGIKAYPTWVFANGQRHSGVLSEKALATLAGCTRA